MLSESVLRASTPGFVAVLLLLSAEWLLRKRAGMIWYSRMHAPRGFLPAFLILALLTDCTKTVRNVEPTDYDTALADTTHMFEIHTRDGAQFVSKKAHVEGDTVLVVTKGYQVQTDPWRQKKLASVPIPISMNSIEHISQIEIDHDTSLAVVLLTLALVLGVAVAIGLASGLGGP